MKRGPSSPASSRCSCRGTFRRWSPEFRGRAELEKLFRKRSERQKNYRLRKELQALMGDTIANYWEGEWEDSVTGAKMAGRGVENLGHARWQDRRVGSGLQRQ
jgi:nuclear transport factor 2 (NTF2) superfamily protein